MRMISRREALEIIDAHGWGASVCTVSHARDWGVWNSTLLEPHCESFDDCLGVHDQYAVIDVKNWLGY